MSEKTKRTQFYPFPFCLFPFPFFLLYETNPIIPLPPLKQMNSCFYPKDRYNASFCGDQK